MRTNYFKIILCLCYFISLVASGQNMMVIEKTDKTTIKIGLSDINRVYFEYMDCEAAYDSLVVIYEQMYTSGWTVTGNTHQSFGITSYTLCADLMGEDHVMAQQGSGWFWFDAIYNVKSRYTSTAWRSYDL